MSSENVPNRGAGKPGQSRRPNAPVSTRQPPTPKTMRDYFIMFRERWYWGLLGALLVGGTLYFFQMHRPAVFSATATILFENPVQPFSEKMGGSYGPAEINLQTHIERIKSVSFRKTVAATFTPEEADQIRRPYLNPEEPPDAQPGVEDILAFAIDVVANKESPILAITASHRDATAAEMIANRYVRRYMEYNLEGTLSGANQNLIFLEKQEHQLRQQLEEQQTKLQDYIVSHNVGSVLDNQNVVQQRLNAISSQLIAARAAVRELETTLHQVDDYEKNNRSLLELSYISQFQSIPGILTELDKLKSERALLEQRYGEKFPKMIANAEALKAKTTALNDNIARAVAELRSSHAKAKQHEESVRSAQDQAEKDALELQQASNAFEVLKKEKDTTASLYEDVLRQRNEMSMRVTLENVNIKVIDRADIPWEPSDPNPRKVLIQACLVGVFFLFAIPLTLGSIDVRLKAAWEVEQFLNQNLIGEVPSISGVARKERAHIMAKDLDHTASEAFRGLFGHLQLNSSVPYPKALMVTSTLPGEGKSMIANNLAATFASHGKKTLLVDCDFRRPNLHLYYGKDNACGILRWLNAWNGTIAGPLEEDTDLGILPVKQNLFLLRAGGEHRRATELFETEQFARLIATLRQQFDVVILDTPPLGVFPDAMLVSRKCDEAIYVCRFNTVNRSKIRKSLDRLKKSEAVLAGVVLNGLPTGKQSAYYDYYGYGSNENKRYKAYYAQKR